MECHTDIQRSIDDAADEAIYRGISKELTFEKCGWHLRLRFMYRTHLTCSYSMGVEGKLYGGGTKGFSDGMDKELRDDPVSYFYEILRQYD